MNQQAPAPDSSLDLVLDRIVDLPPELVWAAWTTPSLLKQWFTPSPWKTIDCELDLRPGGIFRTVMQSPEGQEFPNQGCYLDLVPNRRLVWTNVLGPGFRPALLPDDDSCDSFAFTAILTLEPHAKGTRYHALVVHGSKAGRDKHEAMGFEEGWGKALDQLVVLMRA